MDQSLKATNKLITDYDNQIAEETRRMAASTQAKRDEQNAKLEAARAEVVDSQKELDALNARKTALSEQAATAKESGSELEARLNVIKKTIGEAQNMITTCQQQEKNSLAAYGNNIKGLLERIQNTRWNGDMPLGPLGVHVKARDPQTWGDLLRSQLGQFLTAFVVTDARDRPMLKQLLEASRK